MHVSIRMSLVLLAACLAAGCSHRLTEREVAEFVDAADKAFLDGRTSKVCNMRADGFTLSSTTLDLSGEAIVDDLAAAEALAAEREADGQRVSSELVKMDRQQFCLMALQSGDYFRRATMSRGALSVRIDADGRGALVLAHYTVREPLLRAAGSPVAGQQEEVLRQVATRQTESEDESRVVLDGHGELVFASTRSTSRSFLVPSERDSHY